MSSEQEYSYRGARSTKAPSTSPRALRRERDSAADQGGGNATAGQRWGRFIQEAQALKERKGIYLALHPETKQGGAPGAGRGKAHKTDKMSFSVDTAAKTNRSRRTIERDVALATDLLLDFQAAIADTCRC